MDKQPFTKFRLLHFIHSGDLITFHWCMCRKRQQQLTDLSKLISHSADGFYYTLIPVFMLLIDTANAQLAFITLTMAFVIERPIYSLLKKGLKRNRPADALPDFNSFITPSDQFSFPSGHTSGAFLSATVAATLVPVLFWPVYLWACLVGASRILLGVHFPTDTLAGALIGTTVATLSMEFLI
ncbi:MAG: phosphatase PAP2 family protein [Gammaproteobacteria bacterium]|nr:MAG: phosphatase PAP2 family protein [Gammaproteobacteria bacterium]